MRRLLVTSGGGSIGVNFVHFLQDEYLSDRVLVLDTLMYAENLISLDSSRDNEKSRFVHGDIRGEAVIKNLL